MKNLKSKKPDLKSLSEQIVLHFMYKFGAKLIGNTNDLEEDEQIAMNSENNQAAHNNLVEITFSEEEDYDTRKLIEVGPSTYICFPLIVHQR